MKPRYALIALLLTLTLALAAGPVRAQSARSRIVWKDGAPHVEVSVTADVPRDFKELVASVTVFDARGAPLWSGSAPVRFTADQLPVGLLKLQGIRQPGAALRADVSIEAPALKLNYHEQLYFTDAKKPILSYGLRRLGAYPSEKVSLVLEVAPVRSADTDGVRLAMTVRDSSDNVVMDRLERVPVSAKEPSRVEFDVSPAGDSVGPYALDCRIDNDALGLYWSASLRFAYANSLVPVTSMESDSPLWWPSEENPAQAQTGHYYYSRQLTQLKDAPYPRVDFDADVRHGGDRSLRITYGDQGPAYVYSLQTLPGLPVMARLWVKGNGQPDDLYLYWVDQCDLTRQAWLRNVNALSVHVGKLDFDGWREFRVPVLGDGAQVRSRVGSTVDVDAPVSILALAIVPPRRARNAPRVPDRSVWIDDITAETQSSVDQRLCLEVRATRPDHELAAGAGVAVALAAGTEDEVRDGRVTLQARDRAGTVIQQEARDLALPAAEFRTLSFDLGPAAAKLPAGPVDVDVTFLSPSVPALRRSARLTFKRAVHAGPLWDFEKAEHFNGVGKAVGADTAPGGANGSARALVLKTEPEKETFVLLHPAMPGMVDRIRLLVKGGPVPARLEPVIIDNGLTGIWLRNNNYFWPEPIEVTWQDWRPVEIVCPPPPPWYQDRSRYFLFQPTYPLNLAFKLTSLGAGPAEVALDDVSVTTHLAPEETLMARLDFPDDSMLLPPGSPLRLVLTSFAPEPRDLRAEWTLVSFQGRRQTGRIALALPPGSRQAHDLVAALEPGIYELSVDGLGGEPLRQVVQVVDPRAAFGQDYLSFLRSMPDIRTWLGMTLEKVYLDWDNTEPVPGLFHYHWFDTVAKGASADGRYEIVPVVGFSADWAGPHQQESIARGVYNRVTGNYLQVPVDVEDWSLFVRECLREYKGRYRSWVFWENPDLVDGPQGIPPAKYPEMLGAFSRWVALYDPKARVVAGGFNMEHALDYLESIKDVSEMPFHDIAVQMNLGELSPEGADVEGFLDELDETLKLTQKGRGVQVTEMDWSIGKLVSPRTQAAYHARALMILNSRGVPPHRFPLVNGGEVFEGPGIFHRLSYGSAEDLQTTRPVYVPKPACFALAHVRKFLADHKFVRSVTLPDLDPRASRAYVYAGPDGTSTAALWRPEDDARAYELPAAWKGARAVDAFGFAVPLEGRIELTGLPVYVTPPAGVALDAIVFDLRTLRPADGKDLCLLDLHLAEPDSRRRAGWSGQGKTSEQTLYGRVPGGRRLRDTFVYGLEAEQFEFVMPEAGNALLVRRWYLEDGARLFVRLNGGPEEPWDLTAPKAPGKGIRESTRVLRGCTAGKNTVSIRYEKPGNCAGYRVEPLAGDACDLARWGILSAVQTKGTVQKFRSVSGTPLGIGKESYRTGLGAHAVSVVELPLDGHVAAFEVTVGVDTVTNGRGSVVFEVYSDGKIQAASGLMNGFSKPKTLKVDNLAGVQRLLLVVKDGGDGNQDDQADWVNGRLILAR